MPIYEFYCDHCNVLFNFFSRRINTSTRPDCPRCGRKELERKLSSFAVTGRAREPSADGDLPFDESRMERAMETLAREAENIDDHDPRQAANLMRKLSDMTGMKLGPGMQEALSRLEQGEDPDVIETEMGALMENEDPFLPQEKRQGGQRRSPPVRDETLYELSC